VLVASRQHDEQGLIRKAGLFIELKCVKGGKISPEGYEWLAALSAAGYFAEVAYGADEAWDLIMAYLKADGLPAAR
jgi:hypothetical protein